MGDLLGEEEREQVNLVLECIKAFEDGDDDYYDAIITIIKGIKNFCWKTNYIVAKEKLIIAYSKLTTKIIVRKSYILNNLHSVCDAYLEYYKECTDLLTEYLSVGAKTGDYPDLEAAYLLTIHLSGIQENINDYLGEIRNIIRSYICGYEYYRNTAIPKRCEKRKETVVALVNSIKKTS